VKDVVDLRLRVVDVAPGSTVNLRIIREKREMDVSARLTENTDSQEGQGSGKDEAAPESDRPSDLGLSLEDLTQQTRRQLDLAPEVDGVVVTGVDPGKPAGEAGLQRGDIIQKVGGVDVHSVRALNRELDKARTGKPILFLVQRGENQLFLAVRVPQ
jgi:serine protease Do